jgi:hypothetical protein
MGVEIRVPLLNRICQSIQLIRHSMQQEHLMQPIPVIGAIPRLAAFGMTFQMNRISSEWHPECTESVLSKQ